MLIIYFLFLILWQETLPNRSRLLSSKSSCQTKHWNHDHFTEMCSTVSQRTTSSFLSHRERFKVSQHYYFHWRTNQKNDQASPQVYLNIAEVLEVSHQMAKALHKDMKGAIKPLHRTGIPSICSHRSQMVATLTYKGNTIMKLKNHTSKTITTGCLGKQFN